MKQKLRITLTALGLALAATAFSAFAGANSPASATTDLIASAPTPMIKDQPAAADKKERVESNGLLAYFKDGNPSNAQGGYLRISGGTEAPARMTSRDTVHWASVTI